MGRPAAAQAYRAQHRLGIDRYDRVLARADHTDYHGATSQAAGRTDIDRRNLRTGRGQCMSEKYKESTAEGGVIRLEKWPEGYVLWDHGKIVWKSWLNV